MINQLRTLLLNQPSGAIPPISYPGEEYVPTGYSPPVLTDALATIHSLLFGRTPDRALLNLRLRQLLGIIHTSELAEFVYALDPRVTYWPDTNESLYTFFASGPIITVIAGTSTLYLAGNAFTPTNNEKLYYNYLIDVTDGSHVAVVDQTISGPLVVYGYTITAGLSSLVPLPNTTVQFQFQTGVGAQWNVSWLTYPPMTLADVYNDLRQGLTADLATALFGADPTEPMLTFQNLWFENPYPPYQLGAVALALGYAINNLVT